MELSHVSKMTGGWFIGNFTPSVVKTSDFEVCVKNYAMGVREPAHYQLTATEVTVIIQGKARMGSQVLNAGDIVTLAPFEVADFEALTDVALVAVKFPSLPADKVLANE